MICVGISTGAGVRFHFVEYNYSKALLFFFLSSSAQSLESATRDKSPSVVFSTRTANEHAMLTRAP